MKSTLMFLIISLSQVSVALAGSRKGPPPFANVCSIADGTGRPATATSTFVFAQQGITASPDRAVDNIPDPNFFNRSCYHSGIGDLMPRWVVDLGLTKQIKSVKILNRENFPERLSNVTVEIYNEDPLVDPLANGTVCGFIKGGIPASTNVTVSCPYTFEGKFLWYSKATYPSGRYVSIMKDGEYLQLCEVVVHVVATTKVYVDPHKKNH